MEQKAIQIKEKVRDLTTRLSAAERELKDYQSSCSHDLSVKYDPIINEAYTIPGDPVGTMGIDWRGPTHVPREEIPRWKRSCSTCGLEEYTQRVEEEIKKIQKPVWGR